MSCGARRVGGAGIAKTTVLDAEDILRRHVIFVRACTQNAFHSRNGATEAAFHLTNIRKQQSAM